MPQTSARLALAMLGLQVSIGALNDLVDADLDAGMKPGKPIPRGAATPADARAIAVSGLGLAVLLLISSGPAALAVLGACAACGYGYDLRLSRTALSWLPLAIALPLVPVFAWVGATGSVPSMLLVIVQAGTLAGAGLALANGLADEERDRSVGSATAAVRLGPRRTWLAQAGLLVGAVATIVAARPGALLGSGATSPPLGGVLIAGGIAVLLVGVVIGAASLTRSGGAQVRERAWELEAVGIALVAAGWLASLAI
jgi:4-hydroxybenzoate polyprenyltransferase